MQISKKKTYKILACAMSAIFVGSFSGVASAEEDSHNTSSNNTITVSDDNDKYKLNIVETPSGEASNNKVTVNNLNLGSFFLHGGYAYSGYGNATGNYLYVNNVTVAHIHAGHAYYGNATDNFVYFNGGEVTEEIGAGYSHYGNASNNHLYIYDGKITGKVYGGYASYNGGTSGDAIGNTLNISGGEIIGDVYGGRAENGYAKNNEINIYGSPNLSNANLYAGKGVSDDAVSGNNLNIYTKALTVNNIGGFENLNFILPSNTENGNTILTINSPSAATPLSNKINVSSSGDSNLTTGNIVTLITTPSPSGLILGKYDNNGTLSVGISLDYALTLEEIKSGSITTGFKATVGELQTTTLKEQTELLTAPVVDSASLLDSGTDRLSEWLPPEGLDYMNSSPTAGFDPFVGIGGSTLKINTGNGTELKTKSGGINFGMTRYLKNRHGVFIIAPIVDYGRDAYDSVLPDANGTRGSGHSQYFMGGLIARQANVNGMYYEGSFRYGKIRTNFISHNFLVHGKPATAGYEASTPCYAGHVRIGWRNHISPQNILDLYGLYSFNRISGFTTKVSTGEDYSFSAVNSGRIRIGARFTRELKERENVYSSIAYIHEFSGETVGEYMGMITPRASLKGSAGLIELGWQVKPAKNSVAMLDTSLSWWIGDRKGVTFAMKFKKDF